MTASQHRFSIQKYDNVEYHYVFRLEVEDVVRSWVVPKGPSPDPRVKRLAIPVDDELAIDFEGVLSEGSRKGKVIVWDSGPYRAVHIDGEPLSINEGLDDGRIDFHIEGQKLQGGFTLLRIEEGTTERWLLMKTPDQTATKRRDPVVTEPLSVLSGKDVNEVD